MVATRRPKRPPPPPASPLPDGFAEWYTLARVTLARLMAECFRYAREAERSAAFGAVVFADRLSDVGEDLNQLDADLSSVIRFPRGDGPAN